MKIIVKRKDGSTYEVTAEQAREMLAKKEAKIDLTCRTEKVIEDGKEVLNIFVPSLNKLAEYKEPNL